MQLKILNLADVLDAIPLLAMWMYDEWGHLKAHSSIRYCIAQLSERLNVDAIPTALVAAADVRIVGTVSLVEHDMTERTDLSPWLSSLYVPDAARGMGVGSALVQCAVEKAAALGAERLYLFTPSAEEFYAGLGWKTIDRMTYRDEQVAIMMIETGAVKA